VIVFAANVEPIIRDLFRQGFKSRRAIASELNWRCVPTARGGKWGAQTVANAIRRFPARQTDSIEPSAQCIAEALQLEAVRHEPGWL
jgi:hypothetical protein